MAITRAVETQACLPFMSKQSHPDIIAPALAARQGPHACQWSVATERTAGDRCLPVPIRGHVVSDATSVVLHLQRTTETRRVQLSVVSSRHSVVVGSRSLRTSDALGGRENPATDHGPRSNRNGPRSNRNGPRSNRNGPRSNRNGPRSNRNGPRTTDTATD